MREIKFRAWDEINKIMEYNVNINQGKAVKQGYQWFNTENTIYHSDLMQYTGSTDKNGREIYEGDIVKISSPYSDDIISKVVWGGTEYPAFDLPRYEADTMNAFSAFYLNGEDEMEIIGNIHENPELLEVQT